MSYFSSGKADGLFLHTGWRTGGTWLWSCFREQPGLTGFYEPLHEFLADITPEGIHEISGEGWKSGHPQKMRPYFEEYAPLINPGHGGVNLFSRDFTFTNFFPDADQDDPALFAYLTQLFAHARASRTKPVFKFTRSMGRIRWMKRQFPNAAHVALIRNPVSQFISGFQIFRETGNAYFLAMPFAVLAANHTQPSVTAAIDAFDVPLPRLDSPPPEAIILAASAHVRFLSPEERYRGFLAFWLLSAAGIPDNIDLLIQNETMLASSAARADIARRIGKLIGIPSNLETSRPAPGEVMEAPPEFGFPPLELCALHRLAMTRVDPNSRHARAINISLAGGMALALGKTPKWAAIPWTKIAQSKSWTLIAQLKNLAQRLGRALNRA
jgi:hypothetical protein